MKKISLLLALPLGFMACMTDTGEPASPRPDGTIQIKSPYIETNGKLVYPAQIRTHYECESDGKLDTEVDTVREGSLDFEIVGDTLFLDLFHAETFPSGAVVQTDDLFQKKGAGKGILGQWIRLTRIPRIRVLAGELTPEERERLDQRLARNLKSRTRGTFTLHFEDDTLKTYFDYHSAEDFVESWNGRALDSDERPDSAVYAISLRILDKYTVELTGEKTGEKVRIFSLSTETMTYTSDIPEHTRYTYDESPYWPSETPKACPEQISPLTPAWYDAFLLENRKS